MRITRWRCVVGLDTSSGRPLGSVGTADKSHNPVCPFDDDGNAVDGTTEDDTRNKCDMRLLSGRAPILPLTAAGPESLPEVPE